MRVSDWELPVLIALLRLAFEALLWGYQRTRQQGWLFAALAVMLFETEARKLDGEGRRVEGVEEGIGEVDEGEGA
jgi:hypothetical protein